MTNTEISQLIASLVTEFGNKFELRHLRPTVAGGGHALDVDSSLALGTISIWESGTVDWQFVDAETGLETLVGSETTESVSALRAVVLRLFRDIAASRPPAPDS
jgi:hypothetical protein